MFYICLLIGIYYVHYQTKDMIFIRREDIEDQTIYIPPIITTQYVTVFKELFMNKTKYYPDKIVLYIHSDGGNVETVQFMSQLLNAYNGEIICIGNNVASAAFNLFHHCDTRYVVENATLMQHEITYLTVPVTLLRVGDYGISVDEMQRIHQYVDTIYNSTATRLQLTLTEYKSKINGTDWVVKGGKQIVQQGLADKIIYYVD